MKRLLASLAFAASCIAITLAMVPSSIGQLIYGNTFPFWNVNGPLTVTGTTTLSGATNLTGAATLTGVTNITGDITGTVASAGYVGELISGVTTLANAVTTTSAAVKGDIACVALTPGDWDLQGTALFSGSSATFSYATAGITTTALSTVMPAAGAYARILTNATAVTGGSAVAVTTPVVPVQLAAATTYCINGVEAHGAGNAAIYGQLNARRRR